MEGKAKEIFENLSLEDKKIIKNYSAGLAYDELTSLQALGKDAPFITADYNWLIDFIKSKITNAKEQANMIKLFDEKVTEMMASNEVLLNEDLDTLLANGRVENARRKLVNFYALYEGNPNIDLSTGDIIVSRLTKNIPEISKEQAQIIYEELENNNDARNMASSIMEMLYERAYLSKEMRDIEAKYAREYIDVDKARLAEFNKRRAEIIKELVKPSVRNAWDKNGIPPRILSATSITEADLAYFLENKSDFNEYKRRESLLISEYGKQKLLDPAERIYAFRAGWIGEDGIIHAKDNDNQIQATDHVAYGSKIANSPYISATVSPVVSARYMYDFNGKNKSTPASPIVIDIKKIYSLLYNRLEAIDKSTISFVAEQKVLAKLISSSRLDSTTKDILQNYSNNLELTTYEKDISLPEEFFDPLTLGTVIKRQNQVRDANTNRALLTYTRSVEWAQKLYSKKSYAEMVLNYSSPSDEILFKGQIPSEVAHILDKLSFDFIVATSSILGRESSLAQNLIAHKIDNPEFDLSKTIFDMMQDEVSRLKLGLSEQELYFLEQYYINQKSSEEIFSIYDTKNANLKNTDMTDLYQIAMRNDILKKLSRSDAVREKLLDENLISTKDEEIRINTTISKALHSTITPVKWEDAKKIKIAQATDKIELWADVPYTKPIDVDSADGKGVKIASESYEAVKDIDQSGKELYHREATSEDIYIPLDEAHAGKDYSALGAALLAMQTKKVLDKTLASKKTKKKDVSKSIENDKDLEER